MTENSKSVGVELEPEAELEVICLWHGDGYGGEGWYWWSEEYPEDGTWGPYGSKADAVHDMGPRDALYVQEAPTDSVKVGDTVQLRSGGPLMTVESVQLHHAAAGRRLKRRSRPPHKSGLGSAARVACCQWFQLTSEGWGKLMHGLFPVSSLKLAPAQGSMAE